VQLQTVNGIKLDCRRLEYMKKTLTVMTLLAGAVAGYAQGVVSMQDYGTAYEYHVYGPQTTAPTGAVTSYTTSYGGYASGLEYMGNVSNDQPTASEGTAVYNTGTALSGTGYDAQLLGAANTGDMLSSLSTLGSVYHFQTSPAALGWVNASGDTTAIPNSTPGTAAEGGNGATIALAAWDNTGADGAAATLLAAQQDGYAWGISEVVNIAATGGASSPPTTPPTLGIESFSIAVPAPEPSTIALGVMGVSALLFHRRKQAGRRVL
jgi:hypothetical protein